VELIANISKEKNKGVIDFRSELVKLESDAKILQRIRVITNECLTTGAYSSKNETEQMLKFNKLRVPEWETNIIGKAYSFERKLSKKLFLELDALLEKYKDVV
jgi:hypothetical protein